MYQAELTTALAAAETAASAILAIYSQVDLGIETKPDETIVTRADMASHDLLIRELLGAFPDYGLISEEDGADDYRFHAEHTWVIDPLDGTKEFVERNDQFAISIGLVKNKRPVLGVIHLPTEDKVYFATLGRGAFVRHQGVTRQIQVSDKTSELTLVRSRSRRSEEVIRLIELPWITRILKVGSATIKGCLVADGTADMYYSFNVTSEWDTCAMDIIVHEAGGVFTDLTGKLLEYNRIDHTNQGFVALNSQKNFYL